MDLTYELRKRAGMPVFGVADARSYGRKAPPGHRPSDHLEGARSIVVIGHRMKDRPLNGLPGTRPDYRADFSDANTKLNARLRELAGFLEGEGHRVLPVPYQQTTERRLGKIYARPLKPIRHTFTFPLIRDLLDRSLTGMISYRHAAVEAGLGQIGVNNLLLTPEHGARVRLVALLTDAKLEAGKPRDFDLCRPEACGRACVEACPAGALSASGERTDKAACLKYYAKLGLMGTAQNPCGLCVSRCPVYRAGFRRKAGAGR